MLYLDVDGVLNPDVDGVPRLHKADFANDDWPDFKHHEIDIHKGGGLVLRFHIHLSKLLGDALWDATGGNITWHTTWTQDNLANREIGPRLGWTSLPSLPYFGEPADGKWWKWNELLAVDLPDRWVWVDDDLVRNPEAIAWAKDNGGLTISPSSERGLTPPLIETIGRYLND